MSASPAEDPRLQRLTRICLALPEAERTLRGDHADFRVRKKVYAYFLNDHHGDGIVSVCVKSELGENVDRAGARPDVYYLPAYIGARGWFGMRLDTGAIDWREVQNIVELSYCLAAPKSLARLVHPDAGPSRR
jgi:predicted DNA-binding protein (MmcQ/YjbR family)